MSEVQVLMALLTALGLLRPLPAEWPVWRHDVRRTGHADGAARIRRPGLLWREQVTGNGVVVSIERAKAGGAVQSRLVVGTLPRDDVQTFRSAGSRWRQLDLAGDGTLVGADERTWVTYGRFLPGARGLQKLVMENGFDLMADPKRAGDPAGRATLYRYDRGKEEVVWQSQPQASCAGPLCIAADMNGDGADDAVLGLWGRVVVLDGRTGRRLTECRWYEGRNYGAMQIVRDASGTPAYCVTAADFVPHVDVLACDGATLRLLWRVAFSDALFQKKQAVRVGHDPVVRLRGDLPDIVLSVFEGGAWHVRVYDLRTGRVVADLPERMVAGIAKVDASGRCALLLDQTRGLTVRPSGMCAAVWRDGRLVETPVEGRAWMRTNDPVHHDDIANAATDAQITVLTTAAADGRDEVWVRTDDGLRALCFDGARLRQVASCTFGTGVEVRVKSIDAARPGGWHALLSLVGTAPVCLTSRGLTLRVEARGGNLALDSDVPVVGHLRFDGPAQIFVADSDARRISAICAQDRARPRVDWRLPGRSQTVNGNEFLGCEIADGLTDRGRVLLAADEGPQGEAVLRGYDSNGRAAWTHAFDRFPGWMPFWNRGGLMLWMAVRGLRGAGVIASLRRTEMHSEECTRVDRNGQAAWTVRDLQARGCGGAPMAALSDGSLIGIWPDLFFRLAADGTAPVVDPLQPDVFGGFTAYGVPVVTSEGSDARVILGRCTYTLAAFDLKGRLQWHTPYLDGTRTAATLARPAPDAGLCIGAEASQGGFRCWSAETGAVRWSHPLQAHSTDAASADLDGDGRDEFVFGEGRDLVCLGEDGGRPTVRWRLALPSRVHAPVLADVDDDGRLEIVFTCADGALCCVSDAARSKANP